MPFDSTNYPQTVVEDEDEVTTILREARRLIERGWTKHAIARDKHGLVCEENEDRAVSFCSIGAIHRATGRDQNKSLRAYYRIQQAMDVGMVSLFNDSKTKEEVLAAFDKAIANGQ